MTDARRASRGPCVAMPRRVDNVHDHVGAAWGSWRATWRAVARLRRRALRASRISASRADRARATATLGILLQLPHAFLRGAGASQHRASRRRTYVRHGLLATRRGPAILGQDANTSCVRTCAVLVGAPCPSTSATVASRWSAHYPSFLSRRRRGAGPHARPAFERTRTSSVSTRKAMRAC